jgi:hypothetical protein
MNALHIWKLIFDEISDYGSGAHTAEHEGFILTQSMDVSKFPELMNIQSGSAKSAWPKINITHAEYIGDGAVVPNAN